MHGPPRMRRPDSRVHCITMKFVHLVIPDLFLPQALAGEACAGLSLPALQKLLGRGCCEILEPVSLEQLLCLSFGIAGSADESPGDAPIAPISAAFDGLAAGCWLRADPVSLSLQRDRVLLSAVQVSDAEAAVLCASLNGHFAGQGFEFHAPHAQRWYLRLSELPRIRTKPLSQALGGDVRGILPAGEDAARWHQLFNEVQMLLHAHPVNEARVARGEAIINSVWFWGGGCDRASGSMRSSGEPAGLPLAGALAHKNYDSVSSDDVLTEMFALSAGIPFSLWAEQWHDEPSTDRQLLVWTGLRGALQRGDLAAWRTALQEFETGYAQPIFQALRSGKIAGLQLDIPGRDSLRRTRLTRRAAWALWRGAGDLAEYLST